MKLPQPPPPPLTAAEFSAALREAGFGVEHARTIDTSGRCPGFVTTPVFRGKGGIDRPKTLAKAIRERDAEIKRRAKEAWRASSCRSRRSSALVIPMASTKLWIGWRVDLGK
jgi:hypothetical protein